MKQLMDVNLRLVMQMITEKKEKKTLSHQEVVRFWDLYSVLYKDATWFPHLTIVEKYQSEER